MSRWDALIAPSDYQETRSSGQIRELKINQNQTSLTSKWERLLLVLAQLPLQQRPCNNSTEIKATLAELSALIQQDEDPGPKILGETIEQAAQLLAVVLPHCSCRDGALQLISTCLGTNNSAEISNQRVAACLESLLSVPERNNTFVQCIANFIGHFYKQLPAEKVANNVVANVILNAIESNDSSLSPEMYRTLSSLLQDSQHASAILAPLTTNVNDLGQEQTIPNPVGTRLLLLLEAKLPKSQKCLTIMIHAIRRVGGRNSLVPTMGTLEKSLSLSLRQNVMDDHIQDSLSLLHALLQTFTQVAATSLRSLFLLGHLSHSILMDLIHGNRHFMMAIHCCTDMIRNMPLLKWMDPMTLGSMHYFGQRLSQSFIHLLLLLKPMDPLPLTLCTVILTNIPFVSDTLDPLTMEAMELLDRMMTTIIIMDRTFNTEILSTLTMTKGSITSCIVQCMGGKLLPNGTRTRMIVPMKLYLNSLLSVSVQKSLWNALLVDGSTQCDDQSPRRKNAIDIMTARWTADPDCVYENHEAWELFKKVIQQNIMNENQRICLDGFMLLDTFFAARKEKYQLSGADASRSYFAYDLLLRCVIHKQVPPAILLPALSIYSSLVACDWELLFKVDLGWTHVHFILEQCQNTSQSVRAVACKACAELCTSSLDCQTSYISDRQSLCLELANSITRSLDDKHVAVQGMAAFCVGNLAHAIRNQSFLDAQVISVLCAKTLRLVGQTNGKVVGNAIRAVGHLGYLVFHEPIRSTRLHEEWDVREFFRHCVTALNVKVAQGIDDSFKKNRSWKERSNAKKHAWGACHALALLLDGPDAIHETTIHVSRESLRLAILCLGSSETEKIPLAATNTIWHIPTTNLKVLAHRNGLVGHAIAKCLVTLVLARVPSNSPITSELLLHLLAAMTICDATYVIECASKDQVRFLYKFMLKHNSSADAFDAFAVACMNMSCISLEQRFASRAMERYRIMFDVEIGVDVSNTDSDEDEL